jgi:4-aminobutyrate aminotransferase-like enzyme
MTACEFEGRQVPDIVVPMPGPRSREYRERERKALYRGTGEHLAPTVIARKSGFVIEDLDGNLLLDMASASGSVPLGACHPRLLEVATTAIARFGNEDTHVFTTEYVAPLAERLVELAPPSCTRVDFALNGTEAVEIAVRLMRRATGRPLVLGFLGGYHGETGTTASLGAEAADLSRGVRAITPGFFHVPYPNSYRSPFAPARSGGSGDATVDFLRDHMLFHSIDPRDVAGVVIEPVLGSGGVVMPPPTFFPALADGWLLCADEVKSGCGRCGTFLAVERLGVMPDLVCLGKGLGGGVMPIGAVLGCERVMGDVDDIATGSTWAWLPASCATAIAFLEELTAPGVLDHVLDIEKRSHEVFGGLAERFDAIGDVRSVGALTAVEFVTDKESKDRDLDLQDAVAHEAFDRGLVTDSSTTSLNIQPSLVTPLSVIDTAGEIVADALTTALSSRDGGGR